MVLFVQLTSFQALKPSAQLFPQLSKVLKLTPVQEVVFGLALLHSSNPDTQNFASQFVKLKLPDLIRSYIDTGKLFCFNFSLVPQRETCLIISLCFCNPILSYSDITFFCSVLFKDFCL